VTTHADGRERSDRPPRERRSALPRTWDILTLILRASGCRKGHLGVDWPSVAPGGRHKLADEILTSCEILTSWTR
jgi:hypothetical protein